MSRYAEYNHNLCRKRDKLSAESLDRISRELGAIARHAKRDKRNGETMTDISIKELTQMFFREDVYDANNTPSPHSESYMKACQHRAIAEIPWKSKIPLDCIVNILEYNTHTKVFFAILCSCKLMMTALTSKAYSSISDNIQFRAIFTRPALEVFKCPNLRKFSAIHVKDLRFPNLPKRFYNQTHPGTPKPRERKPERYYDSDFDDGMSAPRRICYDSDDDDVTTAPKRIRGRTNRRGRLKTTLRAASNPFQTTDRIHFSERPEYNKVQQMFCILKTLRLENLTRLEFDKYPTGIIKDGMLGRKSRVPYYQLSPLVLLTDTLRDSGCCLRVLRIVFHKLLIESEGHTSTSDIMLKISTTRQQVAAFGFRKYSDYGERKFPNCGVELLKDNDVHWMVYPYLEFY